MATYAEIENGSVKQVLVLNDTWSHTKALTWLKDNVSANTWIKTEKNGNKNKFAGIGDEYNTNLDSFISKKPYSNWVLDEGRKMYLPPLPKPIAIVVGYVYKWSQSLGNWISTKIGSA